MTEAEEKKLYNLLKEHLSKESSFSSFIVLCSLGIIWVLIFAWVIPTKSIDRLIDFTITPSMVLFFIGLVNIYYFSRWWDKKRYARDFVKSAIDEGLNETTTQIFLEKVETQMKFLKAK